MKSSELFADYPPKCSLAYVADLTAAGQTPPTPPYQGGELTAAPFCIGSPPWIRRSGEVVRLRAVLECIPRFPEYLINR
jgi:hypothetical protein